MNISNICRICLAHDTRMYTNISTLLQEFYEKITNKPFKTQDGRQSAVCYICHHLLKKCQKFADSAVRADEVLQQIYTSGIQPTEKSIITIDKTFLFATFNKSPPECIVAIDTKEFPEEIKVSIVKDEHLEIKRETVLEKEETEDEKEVTEPLALEEPHQTSDSDDDVPLKSISTRKTESRIVRGKITKKIGVINKLRNATKADAREIVLSKEEQMQQMLERAKSLNYLHSPHKCGLCYKGFVDLRAFENHQEKHDERSGPYECEICRMRYRTLRHLRTHVHTCHGRQYACNKCAHRSHTANQAREHEKWHNGYTYECQLCSQKFRKPTSYLTHMRKRHPTQHVCNICGDCFVGTHGLLMHKSKAHRRGDGKPPSEESERKFCAECNIEFVSLDAWKRHILSSVTHAFGSDTSTTCLACDAVVPSASLRSHLREHARVAPRAAPRARPLPQLPCEQCGANFVNRSKLQAHVKRIHLGLKYNKNIVCEVCGKKCTSNASLKYHQRTHTGERPFGCAHCAKRFADKNQLRIHVRTHTGERPYCCAVCGKRFSQKPALNRHYRVHTGAKPYDCQFCSKTFSQSNSLKLHVNTVHLKLPSAKKKSLATEQNAQQNS